MKRCAFFLLVVVVACSQGYGQSITFSQKNALLKDIFKAIEKQTDYTVFYEQQWLQGTKRVNIDVKDVSLQELLEASFKDQPITYAIIDKTIILKRRDTPPSSTVNLINITGKITNNNGEPVPGATVEVRGSNKLAVADNDGVFSFKDIQPSANIIITSISYEPQEVPVQGHEQLNIRLNWKIGELTDVVIISNGYKDETKEKTTGSSFKMNNDLFSRRVSTSVIKRLEGVTPGLLFNRNIAVNTNQPELSIRGRSTIFANPNPLIVVDNFPYTGDINNINPNDVESITILKDAAATAIWGVLSGNGVIVITTKTGNYNEPTKVSFNSNITIGNKPDLFYEPKMSSGDYIDVEQYLFAQDAYLDAELGPAHFALSPVVEILIKKRDTGITDAEAQAAINQLRQIDKRNDFKKYYYRKSINQQYAINVSGGGSAFKYYLSAGLDRNLHNLVGIEYNRKTFTANTTIALLKNKLELNTGVFISESDIQSNNNTGTADITYPYAKLADENGNALPVSSFIRLSYIDTAGQGKLLDWHYRPLDELHLNDNTTKNQDYRINIGIKYSILKNLEATALYQHSRGNIEQRNFAKPDSYFARSTVNKFTQIAPDGTIIKPVPDGGILDTYDPSYVANNFRSQVNFKQDWAQHYLTATAGFEIRNMEMEESTRRIYGVKENQPIPADPNYRDELPIFNDPTAFEKIPFINRDKSSTDRYISYYLALTHTFKKRYIVSASIRKDESNLFGVDANQKGVPLWSSGIAWIISREKFYRLNSIPYLKLRLTSGYNGNVVKSVSAYTTAVIEGQNYYGAPIGTIINPPNPSLRWEKIYMLNAGLDFASKNRRMEGSIEYYMRKGRDIIGISPLDPTTGNTTFTGNTANIKGHGLDVLLTIKNLNKKVKWQTTILFSHAIDKVTTYKIKQSTISKYLDLGYINPLEGKPLYSVYALAFRGLDPQTGDPLGVLNDTTSKRYGEIYGSTNYSDLKYMGPANPTYFGGLRNTFNWKQFELSFNITWKAGYYFRRKSINYVSLFTGFIEHPDYIFRWQKPGDEKITNVPSMIYPVNVQRERFYEYSDILVEKADHIRLQDIQLSYDITKDRVSKLPAQLIRLYVYANNLGIIWKANHKGIDPDYLSGYPEPKTISAGIKVNF